MHVKALKVVADGKSMGSRVIDQDSGEPIKGVTGVSISMTGRLGFIPEVTLEFAPGHFSLDLEGRESVVSVANRINDLLNDNELGFYVTADGRVVVVRPRHDHFEPPLSRRVWSE